MIHTPAAPGRRAFLVTALSGVSAFALAGCGDILGPPAAADIYVMRPDFSAPAAPAAKTNWSLSVMRPTASAALAGERIAILKADGTMDYYANSQYPDSLPDLVQRALVSGFERSGVLAGVSAEVDALHADYDLFVDIRDFQAHYAAPDAVPEAVVTLNVTLATTHGRAIVGSTTLAQTVPAGANSVAAAVAALQQALTAAASGVITWTLSFPVPAAPLHP